MRRTLQTHQSTPVISRVSVSVGYSGLAYRLSGCGGWI
jgi:hypothetical protein